MKRLANTQNNGIAFWLYLKSSSVQYLRNLFKVHPFKQYTHKENTYGISMFFYKVEKLVPPLWGPCPWC